MNKERKYHFTRFSDEEKQWILDNWETMTNSEMAHYIGVTFMAVYSFLARQGIKNTSFWKKECNIRLIREYKKGDSIKVLAEKLGKSEGMIRQAIFLYKHGKLK